MIYFKVQDQSTQTIASIDNENYSLTFLVSYMKRSNSDGICQVHLSGTDLDTGAYHKWISREAKVGEVFSIESNDKSDSTIKIDQPTEVITNDDIDFVDQEKLKYYHNLKSELEEKGLI